MAHPTQGQTGGSGPTGAGPAVVYFAKAPRPGLVKTRLCPPLTPAEAAGLYAAWLREQVQTIPGARTYLYGWPEDGLAELSPYAEGRAELRPQRGADLWQRLQACLDELFAAGHCPVAVRGTDAPSVGPARVAEALAAAVPGRVVLGPDRGGGFYLLALAAPCPGLFDTLVEGAATVHAALLARARQLGLEVVELAVETDVDTFDDLLALWRARRQPGPAGGRQEDM